MLDRGQRPLGRDQFQSTRGGAAPSSGPSPAYRRGDQTSRLEGLAGGLHRTAVFSRAIVGLVLVVAAVVWALARGLRFYGFSPVHLVYDLDQPPWLLLLVSAWLLYRSRRR
jgi:hypothetical protein